MPLTPGTRLEGYEIVSLIGEGGMGQVYRARDTRLQREVALKVLPDAFAADPERAARFDREAQALAALNHPNIAQIYDSGTVANASAPSAPGIVFLVMEFVAGEDLSATIARANTGAPNPGAKDPGLHQGHQGPGLHLADALPIARQIALALEAAHAAGIIHRDLKPANVKVRLDGTVKVLDFGLAKASDPTGFPGSKDPGLHSAATMTSPAMTQQGLILGTAAYMSPEQARGRAVDKRADIWAFGCVLYEMLTGRRPFEGPSTGSGQGDNVTDVIAAVVTKDPDWSRLPADTPRAIRKLLVRCLQKDPRQRLHDIADARLEIDELDAPMADSDSAIGGVAATDAGVANGPRARGQWPTRVLIGFTAVALAAGAILGFAYRASRVPPPPVEWTSARLGGPSISYRPRLSPDGHLLAFMSVTDGLSQVSVMKPGTGVWTQLTRDRTHGLTFTMAWSTDGSHIYYDRGIDSPNGIYSVPALGGEERLLIENAQNPASVPDGSILFGRPNANRVIQLHRFWPASGKVEALPVVIQSDSIAPIHAIDANRALIVGRALKTPLERDSVQILDLASQEMKPIGATLPPDIVSMSVDPSDRSAVISVRVGSSYRVLRVTTDGKGTTTPLLTLLEQPDLDVAPDGSLYIGLLARAAEVLRFAESGADPERIALDDTFTRGLAPLPEGRALAVSRIGSGPRVVVIAPGKDPVKLVESSEDTRNPMSMVGNDRAALLIGAEDAPDIGIVALNTGRILQRFKTKGLPTSLGASPDGTTLYVAAAGSISAVTIATGETRPVGAGDSFAVDPDNGDLIVKLDEGTGYRLVRLSSKGGTPQPIAIKGDLRMIVYGLAPGSVRRGKLVMPVGAADSWYWYVGVLDLATGDLKRVNIATGLDFHAATWAPDGKIVAFGLGTNMALWKFSR
ncbi:MAG TPA: protein kinase [Vicinamibacterales bacterium]|nr:protein kinase [Vicinamibacterales bacterium]